MNARAYYNENDPFAAQWLRNLVASRLILDGEVDARSIVEVEPADLAGFTACHFFAGIGGWPFALALAGWPDERPVWSGSVPCQPLSSAGQRKADLDDRHLWPAFFGLLAECAPATVFGEQVASKDGREWLAAIRVDLERLGYACGAANLCAAGVGAPHIRQRLYWLADSGDGRRAVERPARIHGRWAREGGDEPATRGVDRAFGYDVARRGALGGMADADARGGRATPPERQAGSGAGLDDGGDARGMADADCARSQGRALAGQRIDGQCAPVERGGAACRVALGDGRGPGALNEPWRLADWLRCRDGKWRAVEPGTFPLAHGIPARLGRLRGYGNAVVPQVAAAFIAAALEVLP